MERERALAACVLLWTPSRLLLVDVPAAPLQMAFHSCSWVGRREVRAAVLALEGTAILTTRISS